MDIRYNESFQHSVLPCKHGMCFTLGLFVKEVWRQLRVCAKNFQSAVRFSHAWGVVFVFFHCNNFRKVLLWKHCSWWELIHMAQELSASCENLRHWQRSISFYHKFLAGIPYVLSMFWCQIFTVIVEATYIKEERHRADAHHHSHSCPRATNRKKTF